jgi:protein involved in polysaccharide export with SLBB domain
LFGDKILNIKCSVKIFGSLLVVLLFVSSNLSAQAINADSAGQDILGSYRYFDYPIDPDIYLIRPGDMLRVTFIDAHLAPLDLTIDPESKIVHSTLGLFDLSNKTLSQTKELLTEKLARLYNVNEIAFSIIKNPSRVAINVSGAVRNPGLYTAFTSQRVSELIDSAGGVNYSGSNRHIIFSGGPEDIIVDLDQATYLGENDKNPCLYAGYNIYVSSETNNRVQVIGEVNFPREVEIVEGDELDNLLAFAGGVRNTGDRSKIKIIRGNKHELYNGTDIQPGDVIFVPLKQEIIDENNLIIFGAINNPGRYSHHEGIKLSDLISDAGGFGLRANKNRIIIFRHAVVDEWGRSTTRRYPLKCDIGLNDISLTPKDSIYVPILAGYVKIGGAVKNPGLFPFIEGENALYFINLAGGYQQIADKENIEIYNPISRITEIFSPEVKIHDGDVLIVRVREELK